MDRQRERPPPGFRSASPEDWLWIASLAAVAAGLFATVAPLTIVAVFAAGAALGSLSRQTATARLLALLTALPAARRRRWRMARRSSLWRLLGSPWLMPLRLAAWLPLWLLAPRLRRQRAALDAAALGLLTATPERMGREALRLWQETGRVLAPGGGAARPEALAARVETGLRVGRLAEALAAGEELARLVSEQTWCWPYLAHAKLVAAMAASRQGQTITAERLLEESERFPLTTAETALLQPLARAVVALDRGEGATAADLLRGLPWSDFGGDPLVTWWLTFANALAAEAELAAGNPAVAEARAGGPSGGPPPCVEAALVQAEARRNLGQLVAAADLYSLAAVLMPDGPLHELALTRLAACSTPADRPAGSP